MVNSLRNFFSRKVSARAPAVRMSCPSDTAFGVLQSQFQSLSSSNGTPKNLYSRPPGDLADL
eukprot:2209366-Rhodomonas_salina.1